MAQSNNDFIHIMAEASNHTMGRTVRDVSSCTVLLGTKKHMFLFHSETSSDIFYITYNQNTPLDGFLLVIPVIHDTGSS
jgi:hypothetical protein